MPAAKTKREAGPPTVLKDRFILNARPDTVDFRDKMYVPTLVEVPVIRKLEDYRKAGVPVRMQGREGACTGFGLATVADYLLRVRKVKPDTAPVCPRMLYEMARRYDEWPGANYSGSSARGAMKGWYNHGVCTEELWPYAAGEKTPAKEQLTAARITDALKRPLGAYFRVNHRDLVAMHSAIAEAGVLYATATVHRGWEEAGRDGPIPPSAEVLGGHAFAIVAYDQRGFWIQNSWGTEWGREGFGLIDYDDWLRNGTDVWVARLGAPVDLHERGAVTLSRTTGAANKSFFAQATLRPHVIAIGNDGLLRPSGPFATTAETVTDILQNSLPAIAGGWKTKRLLLYAHGGLVAENEAIQRLADYLDPLLKSEVYPLSFIWKSDYWTTLANILKDVIGRRRPEGFISDALDFMLDRLDDVLEPIARRVTGKAAWDEMKENALAATCGAEGGAAITLGEIGKLIAAGEKIQLHLAGHSAGSIFLAPLVQLITATGTIGEGPLRGKTGLGRKIDSCTLWAPACAMELFTQYYQPAIEAGLIDRFAIYTLDDKTERDDHCAHVYHKSLLYLVSNAFEKEAHVPWLHDGWPILGMEKFIRQNRKLMELIEKGRVQWVVARNPDPDPLMQSEATRHPDFDDDRATVNSTLRRILGGTRAAKQEFSFKQTGSALRDRRNATLK